MLLLVTVLSASGQTRDDFQRQRPTAPEDLIADLSEGRPPDQLFAARELRRLIREELKDLDHRDPVRSMEARQNLALFDRVLAPMCVEKLSVEPLTASCADILGLLETEDALPALREVQESTTGRAQRRAVRAIERIEES